MDPGYAGGANGSSLLDFQESYANNGFGEERFREHVRLPTDADQRDPKWRRATEEDSRQASTPASLSAEENSRLEMWYYWL